jgi:hypothetical protein
MTICSTYKHCEECHCCIDVELAVEYLATTRCWQHAALAGKQQIWHKCHWLEFATLGCLVAFGLRVLL